MDTFLLLILLVIAGFLSLNFVNKKLQKKFLFFTGLEFLFIGILIGEPFINFINKNFGISLPVLLSGEGTVQLEPVIAAILGSVGFSVGFQFRIKDLLNYSIEHFKLSLFDVFLSTLLMSGISFLIMEHFYKNLMTLNSLLTNSLIIGITSSTLSPSVLESLKNKFQIEGKNFHTLFLIPKLNNFLSLFILGLMFSIFHSGSTGIISITPVEWFVVSIFIGLFLGFLFFIFLEREENENKLLIAILGIIIFTSGSAYYLNLSPLFINLIVGLVIGNFYKSKELIIELFKKLEYHFYIIILIYAGALIRIDNFLIFIFGLLAYLFLRYFIKYFSGWVAYKASFDKTKFNQIIGKGLNTQGIIAIAIMVNYQQIFNNQLSNTIFSIIVFAVLINEIFSTKITKDLLIDLNEIK